MMGFGQLMHNYFNGQGKIQVPPPPKCPGEKNFQNKLKNLQKLTENLLPEQLSGEACVLHYGISSQKQIPS